MKPTVFPAFITGTRPATDGPVPSIILPLLLLSACGLLAAAAARARSSRAARGRVVGGYVLEHEIGAGGMGTVFVARRPGDRPVALKVLRRVALEGPGRARFEREVRVLSAIDHPNVARLLDAGAVPGGRPWYVMELVDGEDLERRVDAHGPLPVDEVLAALDGCAAALAELHRRGLVHRDVKPANLMRGHDGRVKLVDFGLARSLEAEDARVTDRGTLVGSPHFLAPEVIVDAGVVDARADVYALGALGYYLLTGGPVFPADSVARVCCAHVRQAPEAPSRRLGRSLPEWLDALVLACLDKDPERRPADAGEVLGRLRAR